LGTATLAQILMLLIALFVIKRVPQLATVARLHFTTITDRADYVVKFEF
jgi:hypothetical protein